MSTSTSTPSPKWILPQVNDWSFVYPQGSGIEGRVKTDSMGTVAFINEEKRPVKINVQWNLAAISQMLGNINALMGLEKNHVLEPKELEIVKGATEHYAVMEAARLGGLEVRIM